MKTKKETFPDKELPSKEMAKHYLDIGFKQGQIKAYKKCLELLENTREAIYELHLDMKEEIEKELKELDN